MKRSIWIALALFFFSITTTSAASLDIDIQGLRNKAGNVRLTLFKAGDFLNFDKVIHRAKIAANSDQTTLRLQDLPPGRYSFSILHDENKSGTMDRNFLGIPTEGVAVSNNARGFFGPPSDEAASFEISEPAIRQSVNIVYFVE